MLLRIHHETEYCYAAPVSDSYVEARLHDDRRGLFVKTRNPDRFYLLLNEVVAQGEIEVESIAPVDDDLSAVYDYLIGAQ